MHNPQLVEWLKNPVTTVLMQVLKEHLDADKLVLSDTLLESGSLKDIDLCVCSQLKGQIHTLRSILDIHEFLTDEDLKPIEDL